MDYYLNTQEPKPEHGEQGQNRLFLGEWKDDLTYTGDRQGNDIYCSNCNHWSTVKGTSILFSVVGDCKKCGTPFNN